MKEDALKKIHSEAEKITRRNMKSCVAEYIEQQILLDDELAEGVLKPKKDMFKCFRYITRKAKEWIQAEAKALGESLSGDFGEDVPDDLCYGWAIEYFKTDDVPEDEDKPKPKPVPVKQAATKGESKEAKKDKKPKKTTSKPPELEQLTFDMLGGTNG